MPRKPRYLVPAEVPESAQAALHFDDQETARKPTGQMQLYIFRTCLGCGDGRRLLVTSIRVAGPKFTGLCQSCSAQSKLAGVTGADHPSWRGGVALQNATIRSMKRGAEKRGHEWALSDEYVVGLMRENCHYCGAPPGNVRCDPSYKGATGREFRYSGLDRVGNDRGYVPENVVPCCVRCNYAKGDMSLEEWRNHMRKVLAGLEAQR